MAGSDNFAPVAVSGSREMPPPMRADLGFGMSPRLTLDHSSFEKLLAAAWVLQCLHDQLHKQEIGHDEAIAEPVGTPELVETGALPLPVAMAPIDRPSSVVLGADIERHAITARSAVDETLAEPVAQEPTETGILNFDAAANIGLGTSETVKSSHAEDVATVPALEPPPVLGKLHDEDKERARRRPPFNLPTANLRAAFNRTLDALTHLRLAFRLNLTPRALHTVAIATPIVILGLAAALLILEAWRHEPLQSAQAISTTSTEREISSAPTTPTPAASDHSKRVANRKPNGLGANTLLRSSHRQVTDPATLSAVQGLSKYEIRGLRRQAKFGDASAAFTLGMVYEIGRHVPQSCTQASRWVTTAAEAGNAAAEYNLGLRYRDGDGVPANRTESQKWLRRAAARRYSKASLALRMLASR
jgi:TPR repeat protein